jgi:hypothetical protein
VKAEGFDVGRRRNGKQGKRGGDQWRLADICPDTKNRSRNSDFHRKAAKTQRKTEGKMGL